MENNSNLNQYKKFLKLKTSWMVSGIASVGAIGYLKERDTTNMFFTLAILGLAFLLPVVAYLKGVALTNNNEQLRKDWVKTNSIAWVILAFTLVFELIIVFRTDLVVDNTLLVFVAGANFLLVFVASMLYSVFQIKYNNSIAEINNKQLEGNKNE